MASTDLNLECNERCIDILEWAEDNPWFDQGFVLSMLKMNTYSHGQRDAIERIWRRFCDK